jgi:hypothetical protein
MDENRIKLIKSSSVPIAILWKKLPFFQFLIRVKIDKLRLKFDEKQLKMKINKSSKNGLFNIYHLLVFILAIGLRVAVHPEF